MKAIRLVVGDGVGGGLLGGKVAYFIKQAGNFIEILYSSRDETFRPFKYLLGDIYPLIQIPEDVQDKIVNDEELYLQHKGNYDECYIVIPDHLYRHKYSFDYKKYNTHPQTIQSHRLFLDKWKPTNKIYISLSTTTQGYLYSNIGALLRGLGKVLPNYEIFFPLLRKWNNQKIDYDDLSNLPPNVEVREDPDFIECIDVLFTSCLCISTCNGISHMAHSTGIPRILLDPQYGRPAFCRWRENYDECININTSVSDIVNLTETLLEIPQTTLLPRQMILNMIYRNADFKNELLFKY